MLNMYLMCHRVTSVLLVHEGVKVLQCLQPLCIGVPSLYKHHNVKLPLSHTLKLILAWCMNHIPTFTKGLFWEVASNVAKGSIVGTHTYSGCCRYYKAAAQNDKLSSLTPNKCACSQEQCMLSA